MLLALIVGLLIADVSSKESLKPLFYQTGACNTQHGREKDDPDFYASNSGIPHDPSSSGFMATHSTHRFLDVHKQVATLIGEGKHGVWRFQENGFIRVYRDKAKEGIPSAKKDGAITLERVQISEETREQDEENNRLFLILLNDYKNLDPKHEFNYAFGEEVSEEGWLNWIDLPIYHAKFGGRYEDHVPIDLPIFWCQVSSANFPHIGQAWHYMKGQADANKVGPLGKRAGIDVRENFSDVVRFSLFPDAGIWANIGQGNPDTDKMQQTLEELTNRAQTVNYKRVDLSKVEMELYLLERGYHNGEDTYLSTILVLLDKENESFHSYIRPHGKYYEGLVERGHEIINTVPNNAPALPIENETELKTVYGLATYGHHHMARIKFRLGGGGCPTKGGDVSGYPWGDTGSGFPTNYEEITPLCDGFLLDLKAWTNLGGDWDKDELFLGNAGYEGETEVMYQAQANLYGVYTDPYNSGRTNPYQLDFTADHKIQENPGSDSSKVPVVNFTIDFGVEGEIIKYVDVPIDFSPRSCLAEREEETSPQGDGEKGGASRTAGLSLTVLGLLLVLLY